MILHGIEAGAGPPLVLLHGLFGAARNFGVVQRALAARFRVLALDLRNHGSSPHAHGMDYPTLAADVIETLAARDALPCYLAGHSMGGKVAMRVALDRPAAVSRLVVADIAPVAYAPGFRAISAAMAALPLTPGLTRAQADAALAPAVPDAVMRGFLLHNLALGARPGWRIGLGEIIAGLFDIVDWPAAGSLYPGPTLFIAGERSDYIRPEYRGPIRALFPAARFVTLKGAGHWVHADNPAGFVSVLEAFLADPPAGISSPGE
jgi:pimeloyl-ACP methyl ester carboxylesterase